MTKINYRRNNKPKVDRRYASHEYHNGYARFDATSRYSDGDLICDRAIDESQSGSRTGKTGFLDKSLHSWSRKSTFSDRIVAASIGNDFTNGHRGMAKAVKGAKKFVRSRIRSGEKETLAKMVRSDSFDE